MYIPKGEIGFRVYWEDRNGYKNELFTSGLDKETAVNEAIEYIKNHVYMASFTIVGLEKLIERRWEKVEMKRTWVQRERITWDC